MRLRPPKDLISRYARLYACEVLRLDDGGRAFHDGRRWERAGVHVIYLRGDRFEMAFQHGRLLRDEIADGLLEQASKIVENAIRNSLGDGISARLVTRLVDRFITRAMLSAALAQAVGDVRGQYMADAYGLSEGSGVPVLTLIRAALGPESAQVLLGLTSRDSAGLIAPPTVSQCTSFVAWGGATLSGDPIIGRNTDYPLNGFYDRHPTLIYFDPTDGSKRFVAASSAGVHNGGVAGMNEDGVYIAVHTVPATRVSRRGTPVFMVAQEVLRRARGFDEAIDLFRRRRPAAGWSYLLVSSRERRAATVEMDAEQVAIRPAEGDFQVTTNHWRHPERSPHYLHIYRSADEDTFARALRVRQLIEAAGGGLDAGGAARILGDKHDPINDRARVFPNTVAVHTSVSSSVWLPAQQKVFLASGRAPVSQSSYVELPLLGAFDPETFGSESFELLDCGGYAEAHPAAAAAEQTFIRAKRQFELDNDAGAAAALLRQAAAQCAEEPSLQLVHGLMEIRAGDLGAAEEALGRALEAGFDAQRRALARYARGRVRAHLGRSEEARADLAGARDDPTIDDKLRAAVDGALVAVSRGRRLRLKPTEIAIMMQQADAFRYH